MTTKDHSLVPALDALANWPQSLARELSSLAKFFTSNDLPVGPLADIAESLRQRLLADKLVVPSSPSSRAGKSELINAIFFADTGRRILPASPGRTTMCPVELAWDDKDPPMLDLLPIDTRREASRSTNCAPPARAGSACRWIRPTRTRWRPRGPRSRTRAGDARGGARAGCGRTPIPRTTRRSTRTATSRCRPGATR